jgi:CHAD domain-containing protein
LLAYLDRHVEELQRLVPMALNEWDENAVHQSRVATRRLKAGIDLLRPILSDDARRDFAKVLRRLRRRLGPLRDLDVMIGHLAELSTVAKHRDAVAWLSAQLIAQREAMRVKSVKKTSAAKVLERLESWAPVRAEILEAAEAWDSLLSQSVHLQLDAFERQANRVVGDPAQASAEDTPPDVHELRIAGKALRYTLEMAREHGRPLDARIMRTFKRMQEALGLWHDFVVLTEWAMRASLDALLAHHDTGLQAAVLALARVTVGHADRQLKKFASLWKKEGPQLAASIRASLQAGDSITAGSESASAPAVPKLL